MTEEGKKHFDLYKYLCFPWGIIPATAVWFAITRAIEPLLNKIEYTTKTGVLVNTPWWSSWALFVFGEIAFTIFLAVYSYTLPKGKKKTPNIYILIAPETFQDDKYITSDFLECFNLKTHGSIGNLNVILPSVVKRETFNRTIGHYQRRHKNYWKSKRWDKLHKKLKGTLYISGILKRRSSGGKDRFVFDLSATIGYYDVNHCLTPLMITELQKNFPHRILINKEFELEQFDKMSDCFATLSEYLIGWAHLVSGYIESAYKMHYDIYSNNKQSFFKRGMFNDLTQLLHIELDSILKECRKYPLAFITECTETAEKLYPHSDTSTLMVSRALIMTSTDDTFDENLARAYKLINNARINSKNRDTVYANRAYVYLLKEKYQKAESEYQKLFKKQNLQLLTDVVEYCDVQIKKGCRKEKSTAYYVKALMLSHFQDRDKEYKKAIEQAVKNIPNSNEYYQSKLSEMNDLYRKKEKKGKKNIT